ncbi:MAG: hypothetical protein LBU87_05410 [Lactobacillales bacterium]|jgi:hypothetical protein|nr:hypothetical protein [Lactobacillales bacterium]
MKTKICFLFLISGMVLSAPVFAQGWRSQEAIDAINARIQSNLDTAIMRSPVYTKLAYRQASEQTKRSNELRQQYDKAVRGEIKMTPAEIDALAAEINITPNYGGIDLRKEGKAIQTDPANAFFNLSLSDKRYDPDFLITPPSKVKATTQTQTQGARSAPHTAADTPRQTLGTSIAITRPAQPGAATAPQIPTTLSAQHYQELRKNIGERAFSINIKEF